MVTNPVKEKRCTACQRVKPLCDFHRSCHDSTGHQSCCKECGIAKNRAYRLRHPDRVAAQQAAYRASHRTEMHARSAAWRAKRGFLYRADKAAKARKWMADNPLASMLRSAKTRAKRAGLPFTLSLADIPAIPDRCPILDIPLVRGNGHWHDGSPTLDRIDSRMGYVPGNVLVISWRANALKRDATAQELEKLAAFYGHLHTRLTSPASTGPAIHANSGQSETVSSAP